MRGEAWNNRTEFDRNPAILSMRTKTELVDYVEQLFHQEGSLGQVGISAETFRAFIEKVSRHYRQNPYHNFHHAVDTVNTVCWMISRPKLKAELPHEDRFLLLLVALIHDVEHPGHNNMWEVQIATPRALKFQNEAVLEKHSFEVTQRFLADPATNIFQGQSEEKVRGWNAKIEEMVMATDFAMHRKFLDDFAKFLASNTLDLGDEECLSWVCRALIKAADISNTSKPFTEAKVWGKRVMLEFWAQGVEEKKRNLPVGPLNDPETVKMNSAQTGFIKFAVLELYEQLLLIDPGLADMVDNLKENLATYEIMAERGDDGFFE